MMIPHQRMWKDPLQWALDEGENKADRNLVVAETILSSAYAEVSEELLQSVVLILSDLSVFNSKVNTSLVQGEL